MTPGDPGGSTTNDHRGEVIEHLEDALRADSGEMKNFHVREALQYLEIRDQIAETQTNGADEPVQPTAENTD